MNRPLTRRDANVRTFVNQLIANMSNVFSACSLFLAVLAVVPYWFGKNILWLTAGAVVFSVIPACYRTWSEVVELIPEKQVLPKQPGLVVTCTVAVVDLPVESRSPASKGKLDLRLDISNPGNETLYLTGVELLSWQGAGLFAKPTAVKLYGKREKSGFGQLCYPLGIGAKERRDDIALFAEIAPASGDAVDFARELGRASQLILTFRVLAENAARIPHHSDVRDEVPLSEFKKVAKSVWTSRGHADLLEAVGS